MRISNQDRMAIESLSYNPSLEPSFDIVKSCLMWEDERPGSISSEGYRFVRSLWVVRSFIHRGLPEEQWGLEPHHFQAIWRFAIDAKLKWPGFYRLELSWKDRIYFEKCLAETARGSGVY